MEIKFTKRNEKGLHCKFCDARIDTHIGIDLYETSPVKGIVCSNCKERLEGYILPFFTFIRKHTKKDEIEEAQKEEIDNFNKH